jgi:hypothetical protein
MPNSFRLERSNNALVVYVLCLNPALVVYVTMAESVKNKPLLRFFNLDLHISVIADVKNILHELYGDKIEITNWSISGHNWVFNLPTPDVQVVRADTWAGIDSRMVAAFQTAYDSYLSQFDGFIVTHTPVFCMLYEKYGKPIILVNSCRYEQPFSWRGEFAGWGWVNAGLRRMAERGQLIAVSNNKADQTYLLRGTGVRSAWIPSLCLYTQARHTPTRDGFIVHGDRSFFPAHPRLLAKPANHTWSDLYSYRGIVHIPYEISTMSLFEQYSAGVPLFLPTREFYLECIRDGSMSLGSIYCRHLDPAVIAQWKDASPEFREALTSPAYWLERADYYDPTNFAYVYFYSSREDLLRQLDTFEDAHRGIRDEWIALRRKHTMDAWRDLIVKHFLAALPLSRLLG